MKAVAASSIGQYEKSVRAWADYYRTVQLGLGACFREGGPAPWSAERKRPRVAGAIGAVVCSSDQGLGGPFNGVVADHVGGGTATVWALIRESLFVSLFRACADSLASENASRLAAMQRADKNIDELLDDLNGTFHRVRQSAINEELFDVISGFEALTGPQ